MLKWRAVAWIALLLAAPGPAAPGAFAADASTTPDRRYALAPANLLLRRPADPERRRVRLRARWSGAVVPMMHPAALGATLRIWGGLGEGDSGFIRLPAERWRANADGHHYRYLDEKRTAGGIRLVLLSVRAKGGRLRIMGGGPTWGYALDKPQTQMTASLQIGSVRWCARFTSPFPVNMWRRVVAHSTVAPASCLCDAAFDSTWEAIQDALARYGCTQSICHGSSPGQGGLDLRPESAYRNLVGVPSTGMPQAQRIQPLSPKASVFWMKLAAATLAGSSEAPKIQGSPMPAGGLSAISRTELDAIKDWISAGAPETGVLSGSDKALASCLPDADPAPPPTPPAPPSPGTGFQLYAPPWDLPPHGEDEVCFATYYDVSAELPADQTVPCPPQWGGPTKRCFFFNHTQFEQTANSHHAHIKIYRGKADVTDPGWGAFTCHGGPHAAESCDPKAPDMCGPRGGCASAVMSTVSCVGFGPDGYLSFTDVDGSSKPYTDSRFPAGLYQLMPTQGIVVWNSHAFNVSDKPANHEEWWNVYFAAPADRHYLMQGYGNQNDVFVVDIPPFQQHEYCATLTFPKGARVLAVGPHCHKRGKVFRAWGPPQSPPCDSTHPPCVAEQSTPLFVSTDYRDPTFAIFDKPLALDSDDGVTRTFKFCSLYDNGFADPTTVRRLSTTPARGAPCAPEERACFGGPHQGDPCNGDDRQCDSTPQAGDGLCDACPLRGGYTTEDEMFIFGGIMYCPEGSACYYPLPSPTP
jgi:hypothetical protein